MKVYSLAGDGGFYSMFAMADWGVEQRLLEMADNQASMAPSTNHSLINNYGFVQELRSSFALHKSFRIV